MRALSSEVKELQHTLASVKQELLRRDLQAEQQQEQRAKPPESSKGSKGKGQK